MFSSDVPFKDFQNRRVQCQTALKEEGLNGAFICSRGGGTFDRYAGGSFFANHYQQRCYLPDQPPLWSGRSHSLLLLPAEGDAVLVVSTLEFRKDLTAVEDVRYSADYFGLVAETASELRMDSGKVGIFYDDVLTHRMAQNMLERMPSLELVPCDHILSEMRLIKTEREKVAIRKACQIGSEALNIIMKGVAPGKTESQVIGPAMEHIFSNGAVLYFIVTNSGKDCVSVHSVDFPGYDCHRKMEPGDVFKVDLIIVYDGFICDFGRTCFVGSGGSSEHRRMIELVTGSCEHIISRIKPGLTVKELCQIGDSWLKERGVSLSDTQEDPSVTYAAFPPHWGHGIGMTWERPWFIEEETMTLQEGMYVAVEKGLYQPGLGTVTYEQNLLIAANGPEVLTSTKNLWI